MDLLSAKCEVHCSGCGLQLQPTARVLPTASLGTAGANGPQSKISLELRKNP